MPSNTALPNALAALSVDSSRDEQAISLAHLLLVVHMPIADYLDHESLNRLGETCRSCCKFVFKDANANPLWKRLHDTHWSYGKIIRFDGPPSQRPRNGIVVVDDGRNWREEFIRRYILDKSVPQRLASSLVTRRRSNDGNNVIAALVQDGADIWDKLKTFQEHPELSSTAENVLLRINGDEAVADWNSMCATSTICDAAPGYEDGLMVFSKAYQGVPDLMSQASPDGIYDVINRGLDELTAEDLLGFAVLESSDGDLDTVFLEKVMEHRKGMTIVVDSISARVTGIPPRVSKVEWWDRTKEFVCAQCTVNGAMGDLMNWMYVLHLYSRVN